MNALQIFSHNVRSWKTRDLEEDEIEKFKRKREELGVEYAVVHTSYLLNLASPKDDLWEKSKRGLVEEIRRAHLLGIPAINTHIGAHTGSGLENGLDRLVSALREVEKSAPFEDSEVKVLLENTAGSGTKLGSDFSELGRVLEDLDRSDRYGVCIDTCHGFAAGYDFATSSGLEETIEEFDSDVGLGALDLIHLNDSVGDRGSHKDRHAHIGRGKIGDEGFAAVVNSPALSELPFILETPKEELDGKEADRVNIDRILSLRE
jgi:deoxyribonuclease-4